MGLFIQKAAFWFALAGLVLMELVQRYIGSRLSGKNVPSDPDLRLLRIDLLMLRGFLAVMTIFVAVIAARLLWP